MQTPLLHCAFGPHGDGLHGSDGTSVTETGGSMNSFERDIMVEEFLIESITSILTWCRRSR